MKDSVANKKAKTPLFQVLLLENDTSDDVEIQEADQVDFFQVKQHLKNGGSVFITSKTSQKQLLPRSRAQQNYSQARRTYGAVFKQGLRG